MAYTDAKEIRSILQQRYGMDLQEHISRVEFVLPNGERPYFHISDSFRPYIAPQPKHSYVLEIVEDGELGTTAVRALNGSLQSLQNSFDSFKLLNRYALVGKIDGVVTMTYTPK